MKHLPHTFTITTLLSDKKIAELIFLLFHDAGSGTQFVVASELHKSISKAIGRRFISSDFPYQLDRVEVINGTATLRFVKEADYLLRECLLDRTHTRL